MNNRTTINQDELKQHIKTLLDKYHGDYAILFGSYARGDYTPDSDIDLIVFGGSDFKPMDIFAFGEDLRVATHKDADVFEIREVNQNTDFYRNAMREGVRIA